MAKYEIWAFRLDSLLSMITFFFLLTAEPLSSGLPVKAGDFGVDLRLELIDSIVNYSVDCTRVTRLSIA